MTYDAQFRDDIQRRVQADIENTLYRYRIQVADPDMRADLVSDLVNDAMHQVELIMDQNG
jgi:hypothetical protein